MCNNMNIIIIGLQKLKLPISTHTHTHNCLMVLYPGQPGWTSTRKFSLKWVRLIKKEVFTLMMQLIWLAITSASIISIVFELDALPAAILPILDRHWVVLYCIFCSLIDLLYAVHILLFLGGFSDQTVEKTMVCSCGFVLILLWR